MKTLEEFIETLLVPSDRDNDWSRWLGKETAAEILRVCEELAFPVYIDEEGDTEKVIRLCKIREFLQPANTEGGE